MIRRSTSLFLKLLLRWRREPVVPALLLLIAGGLWGFVELADEVQDRETHRIDEWILRAMREPGDPANPLGPQWVEEMGRDLTALGGVAVLGLLSLAVTGFLLFLGKRRIALITVLAVVGGVLLTYSLKLGFDRPRPDLVPHAVIVRDPSFPSGHSMMAAVVYLTLGVLLARSLPRQMLRIYVIAVSAAIAVLVGISRVYLGVHWPTDVLAGWTLGSAWALACWVLVIRLDSRVEAVEQDAS